jgi:hypothetical protein
MCGTQSQTPQIRPNPPQWAISLAGCAEILRSICSRIWVHGRTTWTKGLRLAFWNVDGVRGRKQELNHFFAQQLIEICLLTETLLRSGDVFRLANCVCHRNNRLTEGGGKAIQVHYVIDHHAVPVQVIQHL